MHVFFEDDGAFKAGSVLVDNDTSLQVEAASGKRLKIKAANVLLRFADPSPSALLAEAHALAAALDPNFLWEVSGNGEFSFNDLAIDYYGRLPRPAESAALALCLHASPMHFYKKGKGRYKGAPADALKAALAGVERKRCRFGGPRRAAEIVGRKFVEPEFTLAAYLPQEIGVEAAH
jgi:exoribonuclease II